MDIYHILIVLCALVILSYLFNLVASRLHIPAVLLLIAAGIGLKKLGEAFGYSFCSVSKKHWRKKRSSLCRGAACGEGFPSRWPCRCRKGIFVTFSL
ncbi:MAG: hypothetical protein FD123_1573 [Bacteroidetes bacterium]|nr:MAG: hypothetical protein FD123_1573 [Bacteroidota bacterium]